MLANFRALIAVEAVFLIMIYIFATSLRRPFKSIIDNKTLAVFILTPAVGMFVGNCYAFFMIMFICMAVIANSKADCCKLLVIMMPMMPYLMIQTQVNGFYVLPFSYPFVLLVGAFAGFIFLKKYKSNAKWHYDLSILILISITAVPYLAEMSFTGFLRSLIEKSVIIGMPYFLISRGISNKNDLDKILIGLVFSASLACAEAIFEMYKFWVPYQQAHVALGVKLPYISVTTYIRGGRLRTGGPMMDYSALGVFAATALFVLLHFRSQFKAPGFYFLVVVMIGGVLATQSRGALLGILAGGIILLGYRRSIFLSVVVAGVAAAGWVVTIALIPANSHLANTLGLSGDGKGTADYRYQLLQSGFREVSRHPYFGQSPHVLEAHMQDMLQGQGIVDFVNTHLYVALTAGLIGFGCWVVIWLYPVFSCWLTKGRNWGKNGVFDPCELPVMMILVPMVTLIFTSYVDRNPVWPSIGLGLVGPCMAIRRSLRSASANPEGKRPVTARKSRSDAEPDPVLQVAVGN